MFRKLFPRKKKRFGFIKIIMGAVAVVLVWRGIWYLLDRLDTALFGGNHIWTAVLGIALGIFLLWFPDKDLEELEERL